MDPGVGRAAGGKWPMVKVTTYTIGHDVLAQFDAINGYLALMADGHGSTRGVSNSLGQVVQQYSYDAYGNAVGFDPALAKTNLLYSGEQFNPVSGLQYLRARWYNPQSGTFNRLDPYAGNKMSPLSFHKYAYAHMNPVMGVDPSGLSPLMDMLMTLGNYALNFARVMLSYQMIIPTVLNTVVGALAHYRLTPLIENLAESVYIIGRMPASMISPMQANTAINVFNQAGIETVKIRAGIMMGAGIVYLANHGLVSAGVGFIGRALLGATNLGLSFAKVYMMYSSAEIFFGAVSALSSIYGSPISFREAPGNDFTTIGKIAMRFIGGKIDLAGWSEELNRGLEQNIYDNSLSRNQHFENVLDSMEKALEGIVIIDR